MLEVDGRVLALWALAGVLAAVARWVRRREAGGLVVVCALAAGAGVHLVLAAQRAAVERLGEAVRQAGAAAALPGEPTLVSATVVPEGLAPLPLGPHGTQAAWFDLALLRRIRGRPDGVVQTWLHAPPLRLAGADGTRYRLDLAKTRARVFARHTVHEDLAPVDGTVRHGALAAQTGRRGARLAGAWILPGEPALLWGIASGGPGERELAGEPRPVLSTLDRDQTIAAIRAGRELQWGVEILALLTCALAAALGVARWRGSLREGRT